MWLITKHGFYSAVEHRTQKDKVLVRARAEADLKDLRKRYLPGIKIESSPIADYPYRALVSKDDWAGAVAEMCADIDYDNFKSSIKDNHRHGLYLRVWGVLQGLERRKPTRESVPFEYDYDTWPVLEEDPQYSFPNVLGRLSNPTKRKPKGKPKKKGKK